MIIKATNLYDINILNKNPNIAFKPTFKRNGELSMESGLISIIIPVYNVEKYLKDCLDSVIAQTYSNWEAICVDNGSTDKSLEILKEYARNDNRIKIFTSEKGVSKARNCGLDNAKGEYITFLDSDDMLYPQFLEYMIFAIQKDNTEIACCYKKDCNMIDKFEKFYYYNLQSQIIKNPLQHQLKHMKPRLPIVVWGKIYKREIIDNNYFDTDIKIAAEDYMFWLKLLKNIKRISFITIPLIRYRINNSSLSHKPISAQKYDDYIYFIEKVAELYKNESISIKNLIFKEFAKVIYNILLLDSVKNNTSNYIVYWKKYHSKIKKLYDRGIIKSNKLSFIKQIAFYAYLKGQFNICTWIIKRSK